MECGSLLPLWPSLLAGAASRWKQASSPESGSKLPHSTRVTLTQPCSSRIEDGRSHPRLKPEVPSECAGGAAANAANGRAGSRLRLDGTGG